MFKQSVLPLIIDNYDKFTSVEKVIADYFIAIRHRDDFSSKAMKERLFVSEASLSRFAQKCGFKGYREFVFRFEEGFMERTKPVSFGFQVVLNAYHELLKQTVNYVDEQQIHRFCEMINQAKHVSVLGIVSSGLAAKEMKSRFMRLGVLMDALDQPDEMKMQSVLEDSHSLVIGISLSGKKQEVIFSLKNAHKNGAKTVIITANKSDTFEYCDEVIFVPSFEGLDTGNIISPQFPVLVILDICYYYFYHNISNPDSRVELHQKTVQILKEE